MKTGETGLEVEFVAETNSLAVFWKDGPADHCDEVQPGIWSTDADGKAIIEIMGGARELTPTLQSSRSTAKP